MDKYIAVMLLCLIGIRREINSIRLIWMYCYMITYNITYYLRVCYFSLLDGRICCLMMHGSHYYNANINYLKLYFSIYNLIIRLPYQFNLNKYLWNYYTNLILIDIYVKLITIMNYDCIWRPSSLSELSQF